MNIISYPFFFRDMILYHFFLAVIWDRIAYPQKKDMFGVWLILFDDARNASEVVHLGNDCLVMICVP
jgi:hypothetical protein